MGDERRKYYRYPPAGGSQTAVLRHAGLEREAKLVNLSADGFRLDVTADSDVDANSIVEIGDVVLLATSYGFHQVEVVNLSREDGALRLGLKRLKDLPASAAVSSEEQQAKSGKSGAKKARKSLAQIGVSLAIGVMLLVSLVWTWIANADPTEPLVDEGGFVTPTSNYSAKRRHQASVIEENNESRNRPTGRSSQAANDGLPVMQRRIREPKLSQALDPDFRNERVRSLGDPSARGTADKSHDSSPNVFGRRGSESADLADNRPSALPNAVNAGGEFFDRSADATRSIDTALRTANRENKRVVVEFGANSCGACNQLHSVFTQDSELADFFQKAFVLVPVDIDANQKLVAQYVTNGPQRRNPFLALLDRNGNVLKQRRTEDFEVGSKLDLGKLKTFLRQWASAG
jgi:thiol-disulfide isomerase/thioredoxin